MEEFKNQTYQHLKTHRGGTRANSREETNESRETQHKFEDWKMTMTMKDPGKIIQRLSEVTRPTGVRAAIRKNIPSNAGALPDRKVLPKKKNTDSQRRGIIFRWGLSPAHANLMFVDLPKKQTSNPICAETDSTLRLLGAGHLRSSRLGSFPKNLKKILPYGCASCVREELSYLARCSQSDAGVTDFTETCTTTMVDIFLIGYVWYR